MKIFKEKTTKIKAAATAFVASTAALGGMLYGAVEDYIKTPDGIEKVQTFLQNHPDKLQQVYDYYGISNNIDYASVLLYVERISNFEGLLSPICRDIGLWPDFYFAPVGALIGAGVGALFLYIKTQSIKHEIEKTSAQIAELEQQDDFDFLESNEQQEFLQK